MEKTIPACPGPVEGPLHGAEMPELKHEVLLQEEGIVKSTLPVDIRNKIKALNFVVQCYKRTPSQAHRNNIIKKDIEICDLVQDFIEAEAPTEEEFTKTEQENMAKEKKKADEAENKKKADEAAAAAGKKKEQDDIAAAEEAKKKAAEAKKATAEEDEEDPVDFLTGN